MHLPILWKLSAKSIAYFLLNYKEKVPKLPSPPGGKDLSEAAAIQEPSGFLPVRIRKNKTILLISFLL